MTHISRGLLLATLVLPAACRGTGAPPVATDPAAPATHPAGAPTREGQTIDDAHPHAGGTTAFSAFGATEPVTGPVHPGTASMARRLAAMIDAMPVEDDIFGSDRRLTLVLALPPPTDVGERIEAQFRLGKEQLNAGRPEEAAATLDAARQALEELGHDRATSIALRDVTSLEAVSWLRWGEVLNCAVNHNAESCLLPIQGGGIHTDRRGADLAVQLLEALLAADPNDRTNRWVLNIAHMARGTWPEGLSDALRIPAEAFASDADIGRFVDVAPAAGLAPADQAGGAIVDDFTGDGNLDVVVSSVGLRDALRIFVSRGDGTFEERSGPAGLAGLVGGLNLVQADYDGDGWLDFVVLRGGWTQPASPLPSSLVRNRGDGTFEDVTEAAGMTNLHPTQTGAWGDYDNDGDLDFFVGNESQGSGSQGGVSQSSGSQSSGSQGSGLQGTGFQVNGPQSGGLPRPNALFRNNGDGTFDDVAAAAGVDTPGFVKGVTWGDYDNDGRIDLFVSRLLAANVLYHNEGPGDDGVWRFRDVAAAAGVTEPLISFPAWWWDYDNDGWLDLAVSGYGDRDVAGDRNSSAAANVAADVLGLPTNAERFHLYRNKQNGTFENVAQAAGVDGVLYTMGANFGDLDNDGLEDFYLGTGNPDFRSLLPNRMFRNAGDGTFQDVTTSGGFGHLQKGHGVSFADIDNDGDQDVYEDLGGAYDGDWYPNVLFENPGHPANHWVTLRLKGTGLNPSAIGARIKVQIATAGGPRTLHRVVGSGGSFGANSLQVELGLGDATVVERVEVSWPGSFTAPEAFAGVGLDAIWLLEATTGRATAVEQAAFRLGGGSGG
ncbi:MAG: CRTAC1 family protein [Ardenticatenales bacterium]|nr:CRTAC1 family protein [Ardenticatenales bacterium]